MNESGESRPPRRSWRYWPRRLRLWFASYDHTACHLHECPESTVGISVFCRRHTDMIIGSVEMDGRTAAAIAAMRTRHAALSGGDDL